MNDIKMQVVPLKIRFKSCRIALDSTMKLIMILKAVAAGRLMWEVGVEPGYHRSLKVQDRSCSFRHTRDRSFISLRFAKGVK